MEKYYLTKENISSKVNEWLAKLNIPASRAKQFKFQPKNSALLVIDIQEFFLKEDSHAFLPAAKTIIPNINSLIDAYKKKDFPIIFTMHALAPNEKPGIMGRWWRDVPKLDSPLSKICSSIMTHLCCESTARDAFMRDYEVYFVIDATASYNETLHVSSLITLTNGFAIPVKTDTILKEVQHIE